MATAKTTNAAKQLAYLAGALKAPRILDVAGRLADQARGAGWSFEDYLAAVLEIPGSNARLAATAASPSAA